MLLNPPSGLSHMRARARASDDRLIARTCAYIAFLPAIGRILNYFIILSTYMYLLLRSFDTFKSINGSNEWRKFKELKFDPFSRISKIKNSKLLRKKILEKFRKRNLTKTKICYVLLFLKFSRRFENYSLKKKKGRKNFQRFVRSSKRQGANTFLQLSFQNIKIIPFG